MKYKYAKSKESNSTNKRKSDNLLKNVFIFVLFVAAMLLIFLVGVFSLYRSLESKSAISSQAQGDPTSFLSGSSEEESEENSDYVQKPIPKNKNFDEKTENKNLEGANLSGSSAGESERNSDYSQKPVPKNKNSYGKAENKNLEGSRILNYDFSTWNRNAPLELQVINKHNPISCGIPEMAEIGGKKVAKIIYNPLKQMIDAASKEGIKISVCSGYRSIGYQQKLFDAQVKLEKNKGFNNEKSIENASKVVAKPRQSEHNMGISVDINCADYSFESTKAYEWMKENAHLYGFIQRYIDKFESETGVVSEPWHWRYVGNIAEEVKNSRKSFERYVLEDLMKN